MQTWNGVIRAGLLLMAGTCVAADWPRWQGPEGTRISRESGLLQAWPEGGPKSVWTATGVGTGYGSMAVAGNRVYLQGARGEESLLFALNRADGTKVWETVLGPVARKMRSERGAGPRATPTVDGDRVYALTESGDLAAVKADGKVLWKRNILKEFEGAQLMWLVSESPVIDGPDVVVCPGGPGAGMVKLDKMTGKTVWAAKELNEMAAYSSITVANINGVRTYLTFMASAGVGVRASDGKLMFRYEAAANRTANVATPIYDNGRVFFASAYGTGGGLLELTAAEGAVTAKEVYFTREMKNHHGGMVLVDGYLYGFNDAILVCMEFATGKVMWRDRSVGKGSVTYADGRLYLQGENNIVGLAEATAEGYREKGRFEIPDKGLPSWAHPVISNGRLYVRNQDAVMVYDIQPGQK